MTIKSLLGASILNPDFSNVQDTLQYITEDIRVTKNTVTGSSPFELHFGRPPNTEMSIAAERLSSRVNLDYRALENLAKSANQWLALKKTLTNDEGVKTLKTLTERNHFLAATLWLSLSTGTLRLRNQMPAEQLHTPRNGV